METVKINFKGGMIPPGVLYNILVAASKAKLMYVSFGLRQQMIINAESYTVAGLTRELDEVGANYTTDINHHPNIVSSLPATDIFMNYTWLSEEVYMKILNSFDYEPQLKVNISETNQSFTPFQTGNINWVAAQQDNLWHLFLRLPKTNEVHQWEMLVPSASLATISQQIEELLGNNSVEESQEGIISLLDKLPKGQLVKAAEPAILPKFNLTYYEGFNKNGEDRNWLGIYRRDELFSIRFLKEVCKMCLDTGIPFIYSTPWKSLIIKDIKDQDKPKWLTLLDMHNINLRHAANELNFQVEDHDEAALELKKYIIKKFNEDDVRSYGLCIGIKTKKKSEIYSSILVRKKHLINLPGLKLLPRYDILIAKDYNPNERTDSAHIKNIPKFLIVEHLKTAIRKHQMPEAESMEAAAVNEESLF
jgi:hypothetical protein